MVPPVAHGTSPAAHSPSTASGEQSNESANGNVYGKDEGGEARLGGAVAANQPIGRPWVAHALRIVGHEIQVAVLLRVGASR